MVDLIQTIVHIDHESQDKVSHVLVLIQLMDGEFQRRFQSKIQTLAQEGRLFWGHRPEGWYRGYCL